MYIQYKYHTCNVILWYRRYLNSRDKKKNSTKIKGNGATVLFVRVQRCKFASHDFLNIRTYWQVVIQ